jgi:hypothetical protein
MTHGTESHAGWIISGFQAIVGLWIWVAAVLLYGLWRSTAKSDPDPIRPSGPTNL